MTTKTEQHTPGPWTWVRNARDNIALISKTEEWGPVAEIIMEHPRYTPELQEANAQLIAAAPEMLEALRLALPILGGAAAGGGGIPAVTEQARAAIAAAEGR